MPSKSTTTLTFDELARREPLLTALLDEAKSYHAVAKKRRRFCADAVFYGWPGYNPAGIKRKLVALIGWSRKDQSDPALCTPDAYAVAYKTLYNALPDCKGHPE